MRLDDIETATGANLHEDAMRHLDAVCAAVTDPLMTSKGAVKILLKVTEDGDGRWLLEHEIKVDMPRRRRAAAPKQVKQLEMFGGELRIAEEKPAVAGDVLAEARRFVDDMAGPMAEGESLEIEAGGKVATIRGKRGAR